MRSPLRAVPLLLLALSAGCRSPSSGDEPAAEPVELPLYEGARTRLRSDLPPAEAQVFLARLETLELILDAAFPFVPAPSRPPLAVVLHDPARFALHAEDHRVNARAGAFVSGAGQLFLRYRAADWILEGPPYPLEPRIRPLAAAAARRRLLLAYGRELEASWLEEGMVAVFVELAAHEFDDAHHAVRQNRERLLDAYLPLFLGDPPALRRLAAARGASRLERSGSAALAWAAVRYLLSDPGLSRILALGLEHAAGRAASEAWESALQELDAHEAGFEGFLLDAVLQELIAAYVDTPLPVDRWEAAAALRLIGNVDLDPDAGDLELRRRLAAGTEDILAEHPPPRRFLMTFAEPIAQTARARSRLKALQRLKKLVQRELERRTAGYGHPAVERAKRELGRALQRALDAA